MAAVVVIVVVFQWILRVRYHVRIPAYTMYTCKHGSRMDHLEVLVQCSVVQVVE